MSPASKTRPPNSYATTTPGYPVKSIPSTISANLYTAISHATVTSNPIANVCGAKRTIQMPPAVRVIYPGPMAPPVMTTGIGVKRVNVCRAKVMYVNWLMVVGVPGARGANVVWRVAVVCRRVAESATRLCRRMVVNIVLAPGRSIVRVIHTIVHRVRWMQESNNVIRWMAEILALAVLDRIQSGYRNMVVSRDYLEYNFW